MTTGEIHWGPNVDLVRLGPREPTLSPEQCVEHGGHCHDRTGMARPSLPPRYQERCRHCGHERWAVPREPFEYVEGPG